MDNNEQIIGEEQKNIWETAKIPIILASIGMVMFVFGVRLIFYNSGPKVEFVDENTSSTNTTEIKVEIAGAIERPGVYSLDTNSRVQDLLIKADGLSAEADRVWVSKHINLASRLTDGSKLYIPAKNENATKANDQSSMLGSSMDISNNIININTATKTELESLPGIGAVIAQRIIDNRPFADLNKLTEGKIVPRSVFDKIKPLITAY